MNDIYFDVGANDGSTFLNQGLPPSAQVYAFEPTPHLINIIKEKSEFMPNYHLTEAAVSDYNGEATFNICGVEDWGCSSLLEFSEKSQTQWDNRTFPVTEQITVKVIRLDDFIKENHIPYISYFHCDTQGSDLKVLRGMGETIRLIKSGQVEAALKPDILYKDQNTVIDVVAYLELRGFEIRKVDPNDESYNEANIYFSRKDI
jgi:FkbM family methyltransferase